MPPKKKKGKKKGKKGEPGELSVKDKYNKTLQEVDSLKHELETRSELARRNNAKANDLKLKVFTSLAFRLLLFQLNEDVVKVDNGDCTVHTLYSNITGIRLYIHCMVILQVSECTHIVW